MADNTNNGESATWEVVSVTDSIHAAGLGPHGPGPQDESKEKAVPPSDAMFMSGHFSLSKNTELETLLMASDSKTLTETLIETDSKALLMASDSKTLTETLTETDSKALLMASESKTLKETDLSEPELPKTLNPKEDSDNLSWMEPKLYSPSVFNNEEREIREEREWGEERESEEERESGEEREMREERESGEEREIVRREKEESGELWEKVGRFYRRVRREKMFVVFVTATALVGVAILSRRLQRERIQFERLKLRLNFTNERMNSMIDGPLSRIKGIFPTNNLHRPINQASYGDFTA
ncbi:hypothetical protein LUZ60_006917 [Juncus effusus]|nr:hypothetical protein LUZ60_006917 [Juncus effusus]